MISMNASSFVSLAGDFDHHVFFADIYDEPPEHLNQFVARADKTCRIDLISCGASHCALSPRLKSR